MPETQKYILTLQILFSTEADLSHALHTFKLWCATQEGSDKVYGMIRTGQILAKFFLLSPQSTPLWALHYLFVATEFGGRVSVIKSDSAPVN